MKIQYWKSKTNGQWYWRVVSRNGKSVCVGGEGYKRRSRMLDMVNKLFPDGHDLVDYILDEITDPKRK
jgi:uncharacterized protein YegP (UPF0339 family)